MKTKGIWLGLVVMLVMCFNNIGYAIEILYEEDFNVATIGDLLAKEEAAGAETFARWQSTGGIILDGKYYSNYANPAELIYRGKLFWLDHSLHYSDTWVVGTDGYTVEFDLFVHKEASPWWAVAQPITIQKGGMTVQIQIHGEEGKSSWYWDNIDDAGVGVNLDWPVHKTVDNWVGLNNTELNFPGNKYHFVVESIGAKPVWHSERYRVYIYGGEYHGLVKEAKRDGAYWFGRPAAPGTVIIYGSLATGWSIDNVSIYRGEFVPPVDADGDGVFEDEDCDDNDPRVSVPGNADTATLAEDFIAECEGATNRKGKNTHGQEVSCVAHKANELLEAGCINDEEHSEIVSTAAKAE